MMGNKFNFEAHYNFKKEPIIDLLNNLVDTETAKHEKGE